MSYSQGVVSVGTSPTPICLPGPNGVVLQNLGAQAVFLGGPGVTATATAGAGGPQLPAAMATAQHIALRGARPDEADSDDHLYGIVAATPSLVAFLTVT